jgi:ectoine hydroxylase-related dioxygenase (phytanoyl-CoA dioxygenase family)
VLTDDQIAAFRRDGFLVLQQAVVGDELRRLQQATADIVTAGVEYGRGMDADDPPPVGSWDVPVDLGVYFDPGYLYAADGRGHRMLRRVEWLWRRDPIFLAVTANPTILNAVWQLLETPFVPTNDSLVLKLPEAGAEVSWHRDVELHDIVEAGGDPCRDFTIDIYLDPSTRDNGALWAIPGSHRGEPVSVPTSDFTRRDAVVLEARPGDVFVHATTLLHGSPPNTSGASRRTVYLHFRGPSGLGARSTEAWVQRTHGIGTGEFVGRQLDLLRTALSTRAGAGLPDHERYEGPVERPQVDAAA